MNKITLEIIFDNGDIKGWVYDVKQYKDMDALKANMAQDFELPLENCSEVTIIVDGQDHTIGLPEGVGADFVTTIFADIEEQGA